VDYKKVALASEDILQQAIEAIARVDKLLQQPNVSNADKVGIAGVSIDPIVGNFVFENLKGNTGATGQGVNVIDGIYSTNGGMINNIATLPLPAFADTNDNDAYIFYDPSATRQVQVQSGNANGLYDLYLHGTGGTDWTIILDWGGVPGKDAPPAKIWQHNITFDYSRVIVDGGKLIANNDTIGLMPIFTNSPDKLTAEELFTELQKTTTFDFNNIIPGTDEYGVNVENPISIYNSPDMRYITPFTWARQNAYTLLQSMDTNFLQADLTKIIGIKAGTYTITIDNDTAIDIVVQNAEFTDRVVEVIVQGEKGDTGVQGIKGDKGDKGDTGE
jgi:hypothetical protein